MRAVVRGFVFLVLGLAVVPASAQIPDEFTNLEVLPKDIGKRQLVILMRNFSVALGVRCDHCHAAKEPGSQELDFASDKPETKKVARAMMAMTGEINNKLMPATGRESTNQVRCVTCHRGVTKPQALSLILLDVADADGVDAALAKYREMRAEYYGQGAYDFGGATLSEVAQVLAQDRGDLEGAIEVMELNAEMNPEGALVHMMLGQLYALEGNATAARASLERCLELDPGIAQARQILEKLPSP
jgi:hypothetical protein